MHHVIGKACPFHACVDSAEVMAHTNSPWRKYCLVGAAFALLFQLIALDTLPDGIVADFE